MELKPLLETILFDIDEQRSVLTWSGSLEVAAPYPAEMCDSMRRAVRWVQR